MTTPAVTAFTIIIAISGAAVTVSAAPVCRAREGFGDPLRVQALQAGRSSGIAKFRVHAECEAGAEGTWTIQFDNAVRGTTHALRPINTRGRPRTLKPSRRNYRIDLYDKTSVCRDLDPPPGTKTVVRGPPGRRYTAFEATVTARLVGTGALAGLSMRRSATVYCPACGHHSRGGRIYVRLPRARRRGTRPEPHLEVRLTAEWLACAKPSSTLALRLFDGETRKDALNALRPYAVIEGLERRIEATGRDRAARIPLDWSTICRRSKEWVAYELWGEGDLHRASGGGRGAVQVDCP